MKFLQVLNPLVYTFSLRYFKPKITNLQLCIYLKQVNYEISYLKKKIIASSQGRDLTIENDQDILRDLYKANWNKQYVDFTSMEAEINSIYSITAKGIRSPIMLA